MAFTDPLRAAWRTSTPATPSGSTCWWGAGSSFADLGFGDLLLCFPRRWWPQRRAPRASRYPGKTDFLVLAHARPTTGPPPTGRTWWGSS
ncbi:histidine kinase N-terminal domain-containing protein [Kocuria rhizophila]|nr:histidine kinase N-terminal domain-containing protein [Kocuria rhizophila]